MAIEILPLSQALGAEITGIDLSQGVSADAFDKIRETWLRHKVILFRGQHLSGEDQLRFARMFGALQAVRTATDIVGENQYAMHVANRPVDGKPGILPDGEMQFHTDQCYYRCPSRATLLFALEIPATGGNTRFLDAGKAYDALAAEEKARLCRLDVMNVYDYGRNPTVKGTEVAADAPRFVHPMVIVHPETGAHLLFANRLMTDHIVGLARQESDRILAGVFDHAEQSRFIHEHVWMPGDLVMWDNLAVMHARTDFDAAETRVLRRVAVKGPRPAGISR